MTDADEAPGTHDSMGVEDEAVRVMFEELSVVLEAIKRSVLAF